MQSRELSTEVRQLVLRVEPNAGKNIKNVRLETLGLSTADHDGGTYSSVYLKSAEEKADANVPRLTVLAYAAAHEIGQLLLGNQAHTPQGLIKATWGPNDFLAMAQTAFISALSRPGNWLAVTGVRIVLIPVQTRRLPFAAEGGSSKPIASESSRYQVEYAGDLSGSCPGRQ